ncbi:hypothetical protein ABW19_dt0203188 [Dactylella cylindrospora]|nr:hypothetical protein ABW19_dt0203188 [Dactylella cylindrospora]
MKANAGIFVVDSRLEGGLEDSLNLGDRAASGTAESNHLEVNIGDSSALNALPALPAAVLLANIVHILLEVAVNLGAAGGREALLLLVVPVSKVVALARWEEVVAAWLVLVHLEGFGDLGRDGAAVGIPDEGWGHEFLVAVVLDEGVDWSVVKEAVGSARGRALRVTLGKFLARKIFFIEEIEIALVIVDISDAANIFKIDFRDVRDDFRDGNSVSWLRRGSCLRESDQGGREYNEEVLDEHFVCWLNVQRLNLAIAYMIV